MGEVLVCEGGCLGEVGVVEWERSVRGRLAFGQVGAWWISLCGWVDALERLC